MKVLIIWELIPEETKLYLISIDDAETLKKLKLAHGNVINSDPDGPGLDAATWLSEWIETQAESEIKIENERPIQPVAGVDLIVHTGFYL